MDRVLNWPQLLLHFCEIVKKAQIPATTPVTAVGNISFRLLRMIANNEWNKSIGNIEGNCLVAALHLACMHELDTKDSFPDIPEKLETVADG
jgi:hypothetical protein